MGYFINPARIIPFMPSKLFIKGLLFGICALLLILFSPSLLLLALLGGNALLALLVRPFKFFLAGVELVTLSTLIAGIMYGVKVGLVVGVLSVLINHLALGRLTWYAFPTMAAYACLGIIAGLFPGSITVLGILFVLCFNFLIMPLLLFMGGNMIKGVSYIGVNILFNLFIFLTFAPKIL
jgi:hypothetical protein